MQFIARNKYVWYSPYKLRPLADVIRGKNAVDALNWLTIYKSQRTVALKKTLESAVANAKDRQGIDKQDLVVSKVCIDQGPIRKYFKPGAMGRASIQRSRACHITVEVSVAGSKKIAKRA